MKQTPGGRVPPAVPGPPGAGPASGVRGFGGGASGPAQAEWRRRRGLLRGGVGRGQDPGRLSGISVTMVRAMAGRGRVQRWPRTRGRRPVMAAMPGEQDSSRAPRAALRRGWRAQCHVCAGRTPAGWRDRERSLAGGSVPGPRRWPGLRERPPELCGSRSAGSARGVLPEAAGSPDADHGAAHGWRAIGSNAIRLTDAAIGRGRRDGALPDRAMGRRGLARGGRAIVSCAESKFPGVREPAAAPAQ